jgi:hypothetical protein
MKPFTLKTIFSHPSEYHFADPLCVWNIYVQRREGVYYISCFYWDAHGRDDTFVRNFYLCRAYSLNDLMFKIVEHCLPIIRRYRDVYGDN